MKHGNQCHMYIWHQNSSNISGNDREGNPIAYDCSIEKKDLEGIRKLSGDIVSQKYNILSVKEGTQLCVFSYMVSKRIQVRIISHPN